MSFKNYSRSGFAPILIIILIVVIAGVTFFSIKQSVNETTFSEPCDISSPKGGSASGGEKPFTYTAEPSNKGSLPDTYLVKVHFETTSEWTKVEVEGLQAMTDSNYVLLNDIDPRINVDVGGLEVELSRPETDTDVLPAIGLEFETVVQKEGDTAVFRINRGNFGTTTYKLFSNSTKIAQFIHDGQGVRTFRFDLDLLSLPLDFPSIGEKYDGPLFDAHLHLVGTDSQDENMAQNDKLFINPENADEFFAFLDEQGVIGVIGFLPVNHEDFFPSKEWNDVFLEDSEDVVNKYCDRIIPFLYPASLIGVSPTKLKIELFDNYIKDNLIPFRGIGELHGGDYPGEEYPIYAGHKLNDQVMLELYDYAAENNLVVMIHPQEIDIEDLRDALQHNRKTIFLLHGGDGIETFLPSFFQENENVYYSLDAMLFGGYNIAGDDMTKEEFMSNLQSNKVYYRILTMALHNWKPLIEEYPDRMMWGTDVLYSWHFEEEVYSELTRFTRDFIGRLSPEVQEKFGYKNAERLLQER